MKITWEANDLKLMPPQRFYRNSTKEEYTLGYISSGSNMVLISTSDGNVMFSNKPLSPTEMAEYLNKYNMRPVELRDYLEKIEKVDK